MDAITRTVEGEITMSDLISRQAAIDAILDLTDFVSVIELFEYVEDHDLQDSRSGGIIDAIDAVLLLSSAKPERKTGNWTRISMDKYTRHAQAWYRCSECQGEFIGKWNYCPNCGAEMR